MNDWISTTGTLLSFVGIIITLLQINKVKKTAEATRIAAESAINAIRLNVTLADVSSCINGVEEIKVMVRSERYEAALLRVTDISGKMIQLKNIHKEGHEHQVDNISEIPAQLSILRDLLERKIQNNKLTINPSCDLHHCFFNAVSQDEQKNLQLKTMRRDGMNMPWKSLRDNAEG